MPQSDWIVGFTVSFSTIAIASVDFREGGKALGVENPHGGWTTTIMQRGIWTGPISAAESSIRGFTSLAFFYLAYKDYERATSHSVASESDADVGLASWRWKAWTLCGATGLAVGPFGPYHGLLMRPLEQRLRCHPHISDGKTREMLTRWGKLTVGKGAILMATLPICIKAWRLL